MPKVDLMDMDAGMRSIRRRRGMMFAISRELGLRHQTPPNWKTVPLARVFDVARITGIPPERLRPDFFKDVRVVMLPKSSPAGQLRPDQATASDVRGAAVTP